VAQGIRIHAISNSNVMYYGGNLNRMLNMIMYKCNKRKDFFETVSINFSNWKSHSNYTIL